MLCDLLILSAASYRTLNLPSLSEFSEDFWQGRPIWAGEGYPSAQTGRIWLGTTKRKMVFRLRSFP